VILALCEFFFNFITTRIRLQSQSIIRHPTPHFTTEKPFCVSSLTEPENVAKSARHTKNTTQNSSKKHFLGPHFLLGVCTCQPQQRHLPSIATNLLRSVVSVLLSKNSSANTCWPLLFYFNALK
jgi:hypothetical protein